MAALIWTPRDDDTIEQCKVAVDNSRKYAGNAMPWFGLCLRMYKVLAEHGLLHRVVVRQTICKGCVWECGGGGCAQHFEGAHMDGETGEVRFCPKKTTQSMRESQLKQLHKKKRA